MGTTEHATDRYGDREDADRLEGETSQQNLHAQDEHRAEGDPGADAVEDVTANGRPETD